MFKNCNSCPIADFCDTEVTELYSREEELNRNIDDDLKTREWASASRLHYSTQYADGEINAESLMWGQGYIDREVRLRLHEFDMYAYKVRRSEITDALNQAEEVNCEIMINCAGADHSMRRRQKAGEIACASSSPETVMAEARLKVFTETAD